MRIPVLVLCLLAAAGCGRGPAATPDEAIERALAWLGERQAPDGAWRSEHYGVLRAGHSLTALGLLALARLPAEKRAPLAPHVERALAFLAAATDVQGGVGLDGATVDYPNYTSAHYLHALVLLRPPGFEELAARQIGQLRRAQLGPDQGWTPEDPEFGGFGFGGRPQDRPQGADLLSIAVTRSALEALRAAGVAADDELVRRARIYVERCQRFGVGGDGGFFYTPAPEFARSKAGLEDPDGAAPMPRSYGTATCDGIRALLACGAGQGDERLAAAVTWLWERLDFDRVPGMARVQEPPMEPALRVYWYSTLAPALAALNRPGEWQEKVFARLLPLQASDGSFRGLSSLMKEDDPMVATLLALLALAEP